MTAHRCGPGCERCEAIAEFRAERAATEAEIRAQENRFERIYWGD